MDGGLICPQDGCDGLHKPAKTTQNYLYCSKCGYAMKKERVHALCGLVVDTFG